MSPHSMLENKHPLLRSYGRRKSKTLRPARVAVLEDMMARFSITLPEGDDPLDPKSFFNFAVKEVGFEIGFGNGEHLVHQALNNPEAGFIGCEPFINGVSALCADIKKHNIKNILIWADDARLLMQRLQKHSLDKLFLLHPDPWPKTRHHKRRFVQTETLDQIWELLKTGAEFRMATDHVDLGRWMLEKTYFHPKFEWKAKCVDDWRNPPDDWVETRYCNKGIKQGRPPVYLNFLTV